MAEASWDWCGFGLTLTFPEGTVWLQGEDADALYDELEAASDEAAQMILSEYEHLLDQD